MKISLLIETIFFNMLPFFRKKSNSNGILKIAANYQRENNFFSKFQKSNLHRLPFFKNNGKIGLFFFCQKIFYKNLNLQKKKS